MNPTIEKFGFPVSLLKELRHWLVLVRPAQVTLGSLVLAAKSEATAY
ncbi:MAG TPA: HIT family protein, partial [Sphingomicrobium sp.]|nr:HIT family protein [Sphingomicrobium sp.]